MKNNTLKFILTLSLLIFIIFINFLFFAKSTEAGLCPNIPGNQTSIPPGHILTNGQCVRGSSTSTTNSTYEPLAELPGLDTLDFQSDCPLAQYINIVTEILIGIIVVICVVKLVLGGLEYITSESISGKANGKDSIINAFAGLVIALSSYLVLNTINPTLLNLCPDIPNKSILIDLSGDSQAGPFTPADKEDLEKLGVYCPGSGGTSELSKIANSFAGISNKVTYSQKNRGNISGNNIYLDCSSFVSQIYSCAGLSIPGNTTATMFSNSNKLSGSSSSSTNLSRTLKAGDLLGWKAGETNYNGGHVVMYLGNGKFIEVAGGDGRSPAVFVRELNTYSGSYKYLIKSP